MGASQSHNATVFFKWFKLPLPPWLQVFILPPNIVCLLRWDHLPFVKMSKFSISPTSSHVPTCTSGSNVTSYLWSSLLGGDQNIEKLCKLPKVPFESHSGSESGQGKTWRNEKGYGIIMESWWQGLWQVRPGDRTLCWFLVSSLGIMVSSLIKWSQ